jgi:hypothetical protein
MVTVFNAGITEGAVNNPVALIEPAEADHVTLAWPVAVNCCVPLNTTFAVAGETVMGEDGASSVTMAVPDRFPVPVALIVTVLEAGITIGAVKRPVVLIDPADADQITPDGPVAANCCVAPSVTFAVAGVTVMDDGAMGSSATVAVAV